MDFLNKFGINIKDKELLLRALTHSSYSNEHNCLNYERLEFLGDAVLQILMSDYLYNNMELNEGDMSKTRASYVCESACVKYAEAIMGCIYLDQGLDAAKSLFEQVVIPCVKNNSIFLGDYKSKLQELVQTTKKSLEYRLIGESGPAHDKVFEVEVVIDEIIYGRGTGKSKKEAEQNAAMDAYNKQAKV